MPTNPYLNLATNIATNGYNVNEMLFTDLAPAKTAKDFVLEGQQMVGQREVDTRPAPTTIFHDTSVPMSDEDDAYYASLLKEDR